MNFITKTKPPGFIVKQIFKPEQKIIRTLPAYITPVENKEFSAPTIDDTLDLNGYLISHPSETFLIKIGGEHTVSPNVNSGDILVVSQSNENRDGKLVVGMLDNKFVIKYLKMKGKQLFFAAESEENEDIEITSVMKFEMWGVVSYVIHKPQTPKIMPVTKE